MKNRKQRSKIIAINAMFLSFAIIFTFVNIPALPAASSILALLPTIILSQVIGLKSGLFQGFILGMLYLIKGFGYQTTPTDVALQNPLISIFPRLIVAVVVFLIYKLGQKITNKIIEKNQNTNKDQRLLKSILNNLYNKQLNKVQNLEKKNSNTKKIEKSKQKLEKIKTKLNDTKNLSENIIIKKYSLIFSAISSAIGSLVNAVLVLFFFYIFFKDSGGIIDNKQVFTGDIFNFIYIVFTTMSVIEIVVTTIITPPIVMASNSAFKKIIRE